MKKLMFMLVAAIAATMVQGAAWSWSSDGAAASAPNGGSALAGANIYLFFGYASTGDANTAKGNLLASLRGGNAISGYTQSATLNSSGVLESQDFTGGTGKLYAFAVILADDASGNSYMQMTANKNATGADVGTANLFFNGINTTTIKASDLTTTGTAAGWYMYKQASGVPEPTSGLLLVLGGAMLALRRRRA